MSHLKRFLAILGLLAFLGSQIGCVVLSNGNLPPGQEKKISGDKNAKDHAPGQNK